VWSRAGHVKWRRAGPADVVPPPYAEQREAVHEADEGHEGRQLAHDNVHSTTLRAPGGTIRMDDTRMALPPPGTCGGCPDFTTLRQLECGDYLPGFAPLQVMSREMPGTVRTTV
jgi:hypothetical protein